MPTPFLGEWRALGPPPSETMIVERDALRFPDFPQLTFRFRVVHLGATTVGLENTEYAPDRSGSVPFWRFEDAGTFLGRRALKVSYGFRVGHDGIPKYEATTTYLRPEAPAR